MPKPRIAIVGAQEVAAPVEQWLPTADDPQYEVSDQGRLRRKRRSLGGYRYLRLSMSGAGYLGATLMAHGARVSRHVHRLVLETFCGPPPTPNHQAAHRNGDRTDNRLANLRWATPTENRADDIRNGTRIRGSRHVRAKLTEEMVRSMLDLARRTGAPSTMIATQFGVAASTVRRILRGTAWAHVPRPEERA